MYLGITLQGAPVFLIAMISSIIIAFKKGNIKNIYPMFFIIGAIACFVDLLTNPVVTLGLPLIVYFLCLQKQRNLTIKETIKTIALISINWGIGYLFIWFTKWAIVDIIYHRDLIKIAIGQIFFRTRVNEVTFGQTLNSNLRPIKEIITIVAFISFIIAIAMLIANAKQIKNAPDIIRNILPYVITLMIPFVWYFVVREHSAEHSFFTYRNMMITFCSMPIIALKIAEKPKDNVR